MSILLAYRHATGLLGATCSAFGWRYGLLQWRKIRSPREEQSASHTADPHAGAAKQTTRCLDQARYVQSAESTHRHAGSKGTVTSAIASPIESPIESSFSRPFADSLTRTIKSPFSGPFTGSFTSWRASTAKTLQGE